MIHFTVRMLYHNKVKYIIIPVCFVYIVLLMSGCAVMQNKPDVKLPDNVPETWASDVDITELPVTASLLELIDDERLRELVQEAMENNLNLRATALRLKAAGYMLNTPRSRLLPRANVEFSKGRSNQGVNTETGKSTTENSHQLSLGINWELDIWGRLADEYAASENAVRAQEYEYLYARDALAARVIQAWIEQVSIRRSSAIEQERVNVLKRIETVLVERYKNGIGSVDELSAAKSRTEIARADLSAQNAALVRAIRKLEVLLGRYPRGDLLSGTDLPDVAPPRVGIPATVLLNRPDIRAALARVESAENISSSAKKAILPELRLSGQIFRKAAQLNNIGSAPTYWGILGSLFQPLFEGGRIINESKARRTEAEASLLELHGVVLQSLKEVEDTLGVERDLAAQAHALNAAVQESEKSSQYYEERYKQGLDTIQLLLIAKEQEMSVRSRLNEVVAERLKNRINLALALGIGLSDKHTLPGQGVSKP
ncbi:MAG: TolC family protein [Desulfobacterales bacterium]|nr:TolC family protein [Desulfobacterales bacterium]